MENLKKYFQFSGTINGLNYFLRNLILYFLSYGIGYGIGMGMVNNDVGMIMVFVGLFAPVMWVQLTTIYKRMSALFPKDAALYTAGLITMQFVMSAMDVNNIYRSGLTLLLLIVAGVLIFKNSGIENHEG